MVHQLRPVLMTWPQNLYSSCCCCTSVYHDLHLEIFENSIFTLTEDIFFWERFLLRARAFSVFQNRPYVFTTISCSE